MRRIPVLVAVIAGVLALTGCSNDPNPNSSTKANYEGTRFAVTKAGQGFGVDGCEITVHRVTTGNLDSLPDFTLATAKCPTATVTSIENHEGKVSRNTVVVKPAAPVFNTQNAEADAATHAVGAVQAQQSATRRAAAARAARVEELRVQVARLSAQIEQLEQQSQ
jgi:outer membrane murein-binding lipoprotein Lpp